MRRVQHALVRGIEQPAPLRSLPRQQFWVLGSLAQGPRRMSDLAECSQISHTSLTGIVDRLEEHGLVERRRDAADRRVVEVAATEHGLRALAEASEAFIERLDEVTRPLTSEELDQLLGLLRKLAAGGCK